MGMTVAMGMGGRREWRRCSGPSRCSSCGTGSRGARCCRSGPARAAPLSAALPVKHRLQPPAACCRPSKRYQRVLN
eukprot:3473557-Rhodomonas_salina.2